MNCPLYLEWLEEWSQNQEKSKIEAVNRPKNNTGERR